MIPPSLDYFDPLVLIPLGEMSPRQKTKNASAPWVTRVWINSKGFDRSRAAPDGAPHGFFFGASGGNGRGLAVKRLEISRETFYGEERMKKSTAVDGGAKGGGNVNRFFPQASKLGVVYAAKSSPAGIAGFRFRVRAKLIVRPHAATKGRTPCCHIGGNSLRLPSRFTFLRKMAVKIKCNARHVGCVAQSVPRTHRPSVCRAAPVLS